VNRAEKCSLEVQEYDMITTSALSTDHAIDNLIQHFKNLGCRMSITVHFLHSHLDFFWENLGAVSEEQGEMFHQDIQMMEKRYEGKWNAAMRGDYIWVLLRESNLLCRRKNRCNVLIVRVFQISLFVELKSFIYLY
jgi:hypothetical protein